MTGLRACFVAIAAAAASHQGAAAPSVRASATVAVDPRIELVTIVQLLARYQPLSTLETTYRADVLRHFQPLAGHRAVRLFSDMSRGSFRFDAVPRLVLTLGPPPELAPLVAPESSVLRRAGGRARAAEFAAALREFAVQGRFEEFARAQRPLYDRVESALVGDVEAAIGPLRRFSGLPLDNCTLVPGLLIHNGGFQATIAGDGPAGPRMFAIIGAFGVAGGVPVFSEGGSVAYLVQHEFSHSFVNPLVRTHASDISRASALFEPIKADMQRQAYADWPTAVHEHIVRAIVIRLAYGRSADAGDRILAAEEARGFRYVRALAERLKEYEADRTRYGAFDQFFPRLLGVFDELRRGRRPPDQGPS